MSTGKKLGILNQILGYPKRSGNEFLYYCPFCNHHKKKLSINLKKNCYKCWICESASKSIAYLVRKRGTRQQLAEWIRHDETISLIDAEEKEAILEALDGFKEEEPVIISLPEEFVSLTQKSPPKTAIHPLTYLRTRGLNQQDILNWKIGYCSRGDYKGRVVFPSFDSRGRLNYFVTRAHNKDAWPPYKNPGSSKNVIFNELFTDFSKEITLVEGVFDAIISGRGSIPLLGSSLKENNKLFEKIARNKPKLYFALDPDAFRKETSIIRMFLEYDIEVFKIDIGGYKDVGSMNKFMFLKRKEVAKQITNDDFLMYNMEAI